MSFSQIISELYHQPRAFFRKVDSGFHQHLYIILFLLGVSSGLEKMVEDGGLTDSFLLAVVLGVLLSGLLGWIGWYIYAVFIKLTGSWLNGRSGTNTIFRVIAYSSIPSILSIGLIAIQFLIAGEEIFTNSFDFFEQPVFSKIVYAITFFLEIGLSIWSLILLVKGISEVQKFSVWSAVVNLLLPVVCLVIIVLAFVFIAGLSGSLL